MTTRRFNYKTLQTGAILGTLSVVAFLSVALLAALPKQSKTLQNLQVAYENEANAYVCYLAFAERAQEEEFGEVASLFRAAAFSEHVHLKNLSAAMAKMGYEPVIRIDDPLPKSTAQNLQTSARLREDPGRDAQYEKFIEEAKAEGNEDAVRAFEYVRTSEIQHVKLFKEALANLGKMTTETHLYYVCSVCGYTSEHPSKPCPGCSGADVTYEEVF